MNLCNIKQTPTRTQSRINLFAKNKSAQGEAESMTSSMYVQMMRDQEQTQIQSDQFQLDGEKS